VTKVTNPRAKTTLAVNKLRATMKVGVTGTPLPNDYHNIYSLLRLMRTKPWDDKDRFDKVG
jgi:SNF2 family DNA or RNA helicase